MEYKSIQCPYFKRTKNLTITCEGFMPDVNVQMNFFSEKSRKSYMDDFCKTDKCWKGCALYQLAAEKYTE